MESPVVLSLSKPFPDRCGWNEAISYEREWHIYQTVKLSQSIPGRVFHFASLFLYHIPLLDYLLYTITYVAISILDPNSFQRLYNNSVPEEKALLAKRINPSGDKEAPLKPHLFIRADVHEKMDIVFRRQDKKNVLLVGPAGVGKTIIAQTYGRAKILDHFQHYSYDRLEGVIVKNDGNIVACAKRPLPHEELLRRFFTILEVEEPNNEITKQIVQGRFPSVEDVVIEQALELCHFYLSNSPMPYAIIDLFDLIYARHETVTITLLQNCLSEKLDTPILLPNERGEYYETANAWLKTKVLGQEHIIDEIAMVLENIGAGFRTTGTPIFHFAGPTGVGKTELAKAIAQFCYRSEKRFLMIPMAQYQLAHHSSALTGTTPGFVGFEQGGQIQEKAKEGPFVLLLDEIDKADPRVIINIVQHVAEEGELYDPKTQSYVSMKGCFIIMTSNFGSEEIKSSRSGWSKKDLSNPSEVEKIIKPVMERHFRHKDDLLARFRTLYFTPNTDVDVIRMIVIRLLEKENELHGCNLTWTHAYVDAFINMKIIEQYGVRWIRDHIERELRNHIVKGHYPSGRTIQVDWIAEQDVIRMLSD